MKFFIKNLSNKCDQFCKKRRIWSDLLNKYLMENVFFFTFKTHFYAMKVLTKPLIFFGSILSETFSRNYEQDTNRLVIYLSKRLFFL